MLRISRARAEIRTRFARFRVQRANHYANASHTGITCQNSHCITLRVHPHHTTKLRAANFSFFFTNLLLPVLFSYIKLSFAISMNWYYQKHRTERILVWFLFHDAAAETQNGD
jgi:hypothetical protein